MDPVHVLIKLYSGYGLGDAVLMSPVLQHVRKFRPHWVVDFQADAGRHKIACGLVRNAFTYQDAVASHYDREIEIQLFNTFCAWTDRPNTRVTSCLHERFGIAWDASCGEYVVNVSEDAKARVFKYLTSIISDSRCEVLGYRSAKKRFPIVAIQCNGDSLPENKDIPKEELTRIIRTVRRYKRIPLLLDWRNKSILADNKEIFSTGMIYDCDSWGRDAELNTALIQQCEAFIGIDSGPSKCASASGTPSLIAWFGHHPVVFHDPSPITTHLIPKNHAELSPVNGNQGVVDYFLRNYQTTTYTDDISTKVKNWLHEIIS